MTMQETVSEIEALRTHADADAALVALRALGGALKAVAVDEFDSGAVDAAEAAWQVYNAVEAQLKGRQTLARADAVDVAVRDGRAELLVAIGTDAALAAALDAVVVQIAEPYYRTKAAFIHAAAALATTEERRARVVVAFGGHLRALVDARLAGGDLVNAVAFGALARALARLAPVEAVDALVHAAAFTVAPSCHHDCRLEGGAVAIALAAARADAHLPSIDAYLARWASVFKEGDRAVMEARYAKWLLTEDKAGARAFVANPDNKGLPFAAAAVADLDDLDAIAVLDARKAGADALHRVVLDEALARLQRTAPRDPPMIALFGVRSRAEEASGMASDDVFRQRAGIRRPW